MYKVYQYDYKRFEESNHIPSTINDDERIASNLKKVERTRRNLKWLCKFTDLSVSLVITSLYPAIPFDHQDFVLSRLFTFYHNRRNN